MHPPVRPDDLQKPLHIGAVQLLVGAVLQNVLHHRAVAAQALQGLRVGGVAALGLFAGRQAHLVKQGLRQLLGAVQVEGVAHRLVDGGEGLVQFRFQQGAEGFQAVLVHRHADAFHVRQHPGQGQLDILQQAGHALLFHLGGQRVVKAFQRAGGGQVGAGEAGRRGVFRLQLLGLIVAGRRVQEIGRQLCVKADGLALAARLQGDAVKGLCVEHPKLRFAFKQGGQGGILHRPDIAALHGEPAVFPLCHAQPAGKGGGQGGGLHFRQVGRGGGGGGSLVQAQPVGHGVHLQLRQKGGGRRGVAGGALVGPCLGGDGGGAANFRQLAAHPGAGLIGCQFCPHAGLDGLVVDVLVHPVQALEAADEVQGGLFAHAGHAGDVVGGVAHQALHLDELFGLHAVFFLHGGLVHHHRLAAAHPGGGQQHRHVPVHQLQAVPVAGGDEAVVPPGRGGGGEGAQQVVRFVAFQADHGKAQVRQQLFQHRHLVRQLLGHAVAGGLVAVEHLVAEGGGLQVKGHRHLVGVVVPQKVQQNVHEAVYGVGVAPIFCGEQLDAVKGAVGNAVAVQYQQFHASKPS